MYETQKRLILQSSKPWYFSFFIWAKNLARIGWTRQLVNIDIEEKKKKTNQQTNSYKLCKCELFLVCIKTIMKYLSNCEISNQKSHTSHKLKQQQQLRKRTEKKHNTNNTMRRVPIVQRNEINPVKFEWLFFLSSKAASGLNRTHDR